MIKFGTGSITGVSFQSIVIVILSPPFPYNRPSIKLETYEIVTSAPKLSIVRLFEFVTSLISNIFNAGSITVAASNVIVTNPSIKLLSGTVMV